MIALIDADDIVCDEQSVALQGVGHMTVSVNSNAADWQEMAIY